MRLKVQFVVYADIGDWRFVQVEPGLFALHGGRKVSKEKLEAWAQEQGLPVRYSEVRR